MADISVEQKSGAPKTWMLATLAIVTVIALMIWLAMQSGEMERVTVIEDDAPVATDGQPAGAGGETVDLAAVSAAPDSYADRTIRLSNVSVAAVLGPRAFWADIPGQNPFLVILGSNATGVDMAVPQQNLNLTGTVHTLDEAQIDEWVAAETLSARARDEASFATHYLLASEATVAR